MANCIKDLRVCTVRNFKITASNFEEAKVAKCEIRPEWDRALNHGEKCVGHQASFVGLRSITNYDETNWGEHMQRLEGSEHPMNIAAR